MKENTPVPELVLHKRRAGQDARTASSQEDPTQNNNASPFDLHPDKLPDDLKRSGSDWFAVYNPNVPRVLDVNLLHDFVHDSVVCCIRFSADGKYIATGCNRSTQIFDARSGQKICELLDDKVDKDGDLFVRTLCFSPDGKYLVTGSEDSRIRVWDIETRKNEYTFEGHEAQVCCLDFSRNPRLIVSGSEDKTVRLWDLGTRGQIMVLATEDNVTSVAISPDSPYVAAGSIDSSVRVWDCSSGYLIKKFQGPAGHEGSVYSVAFLRSSRVLLSGSSDKTIKMWDVAPQSGFWPDTNVSSTGKCMRTFKGHKVRTLSIFTH